MSTYFTSLNSTSDFINSLTDQVFSEDSDDFGVLSYPTKPATMLDLPEPTTFKGEFNYNYYTKDERTHSGGTVITIDVGSSMSDQEQDQIKRAQNAPRVISLHVTSPDYGQIIRGENATEAEQAITTLLDRFGPRPIGENYDKVIDENAIASGYFSAAHIKDDYIDKQFYNELSSSISFFGEDVHTIGKSSISELYGEESSRQAFEANGSEVRKALSQIQPTGIAYAPTDLRREISADVFTSVKNIAYSLAINNKFIGSIIDHATERRINIFDNEIESLKASAERIQNVAISAANPGAILEDEFSFPVEAIYIETVEDEQLAGGFKVFGDTEEIKGEFSAGDPDPPARPNVVETSVPIGIIIEKFEITQNPDGTWQKIEQKPIIHEGFSSSISIQDRDIKYGATYVYNARLVSATRFETLRITSDEDSTIPDQVVMATMLVKSSGLSLKIDCIESIPPNPPQNLRFHWDYKNDELLLFWEEALNPQRDVVRYQIFRRKSINVPYTIIKELDFDMSTSKVVPVEVVPEDLVKSVSGPRKYFRDKSFKRDSPMIYTLCGVDARGLTSNYSMQYKVTFDTSRNKLKVDVISRSGAPKPYPNIYLRKDLFVDTMKSSGLNRMRIFFNPDAFDVTKSETIDGIERKASQGLISNNYKLQIINIDNQMSKVININVDDDTGTPIQVEAGTANTSWTSKIEN